MGDLTFQVRLGDRNDKNEKIVRQINMNFLKSLHTAATIAALLDLYCLYYAWMRVFAIQDSNLLFIFVTKTVAKLGPNRGEPISQVWGKVKRERRHIFFQIH